MNIRGFARDGYPKTQDHRSADVGRQDSRYVVLAGMARAIGSRAPKHGPDEEEYVSEDILCRAMLHRRVKHFTSPST